jgi:hypothetical protein
MLILRDILSRYCAEDFIKAVIAPKHLSDLKDVAVVKCVDFCDVDAVVFRC